MTLQRRGTLARPAALARSAVGRAPDEDERVAQARRPAETAEDRVLDLQRRYGNAAVAELLGTPSTAGSARGVGSLGVGTRLQRELDPYTARLNEQAESVRAIFEGLRDVDPDSTPDQPTTDQINKGFAEIQPLPIQNMLDVLALVRRAGLLPVLDRLLAKSSLGDVDRNRIRSALDAVEARPGAGDVSQLPTPQQEVLASFGPAKTGTSGDDPDGNTYVVYDGFVKTYFMSGVEKDRRSSAWLANNPGNSDRLDGMGIGEGMKWGKHTFAVFRTMDDGRKELWKKIATRDTLGSYLNYHLNCDASGTCAEGNDRATYLKHIKERASWAELSSTTEWIQANGKIDELLDGFMLAEGITEGTTLRASSASITASMTPATQKTMQFYLRLLGVRAAAEKPPS